MRESELIKWICSQKLGKMLPGARVLVGPGDDAAVVELGRAGGRGGSQAGRRIVLSADMFVEGTHFLRGTRPVDIGWKTICASLSDLAAMGSEPVAALTAVGLPSKVTRHYARALYRGLRRACDRYGTTLIGGDVVRSPSVVVSVAVFGTLAFGDAFVRSGAEPGDEILVTGTLGGAQSGKHLRFVPRLDESRLLRKLGGVTAMIDLSDGLARDLTHLTESSGVGAVMEAREIPVSRAARRIAKSDGVSALDHALHDGEDFELLFTASAGAASAIRKRWTLDTRLTTIGVTEKRRGVRCRFEGAGSGGGTRIVAVRPKGYEHFE